MRGRQHLSLQAGRDQRLCRGAVGDGANHQAQAGFTLLEVIVATALMGLVMVALFQVLSAGLQAEEATRNRTQALLVADKVLKEYSEVRNLRGGEYHGKMGAFSYVVLIKLHDRLSQPTWTYQILCYYLQVTVAWVDRGTSKSLELQTLRTIVGKRT